MNSSNRMNLPYFHNQLSIIPMPDRWDELHLYTGSRCNRACTFCCVSGEPGGSYAPWTEDTLATALTLVAPQGSLKFYGGEPTLDAPNQIWALSWLREHGFEGTFTIFSNGIQARALLSILDADENTLGVLNYSIATGRGEKPLPPSALKQLTHWAAVHPERLYLSHDFVVPVGRQEGGMSYSEGDAPTKCFRCWPTLTSLGELHACPFAVEEKRPHYALGGQLEAPERFARFLAWIETELEPEAQRQGKNACAVCVGRGQPLRMAEVA